MEDKATIILLSLILAAAIGGIVFVALWIKKFVHQITQQMESVGEKIPSRPVCMELTKGLETLRKSLSTHEEVTKELPSLVSKTVAAEVRGGIEPLSQEVSVLSKQISSSYQELKDSQESSHHKLITSLNGSHSQFQQALLTLSEPGELQNWSASLQKATVPLENISHSIDNHYQTSDAILDNIYQVLQEWNAQREKIDNCYTELHALLSRWTAEEDQHRRMVESNILDRMAEVNKVMVSISDAMLELRSEILKLVNTQERFQHFLDTVVSKVEKNSETCQSVLSSHERLVAKQDVFQQQMEKLQQLVSQMLQKHQQQLKQLGNSQTQHQQFIKDSIETLEKQIKNVVDNFQNSIARLENRYQHFADKMVASYESLNQKQQEFLSKYQETLRPYPTREEQKTQSILQIVQIVIQTGIMGLLIYVVTQLS